MNYTIEQEWLSDIDIKSKSDNVYIAQQNFTDGIDFIVIEKKNIEQLIHILVKINQTI